MPDWWIAPQPPVDRWWWFAGLLGVMVALETLLSPHRRRAMGRFRFILALAASLAPALLGIVVIRSGFRQAYEAAGYGWWSATWLSLGWMVAFILLGRFAVRRLPPTGGLVRELERVGRQMWLGRLRRWFRLGPQART